MLFQAPHTGTLSDQLRTRTIDASRAIKVGRVTVRVINGIAVKEVIRRPPWWRRLLADWRATAPRVTADAVREPVPALVRRQAL